MKGGCLKERLKMFEVMPSDVCEVCRFAGGTNIWLDRLANIKMHQDPTMLCAAQNSHINNNNC